MARLPQPGADDGVWGQVLNDFLVVVHQNDGTLKPGVVDASSLQNNSVSSGALQDNAVTSSKLSTSGGTDGQVLTKNSSVLSGLVWAPAAGAPDASTTVKGLVQLTGDLGGTATAPTVPGLAGKASTGTTDALNTRVTALESAGVTALTDAATITTDASSGKHFRVTVAADRTLGTPTNAADGMSRIWEITASAADRSLTLTTGAAGSFELTVGIASPITITNGKTLFLGAIFNATRSRWTVIASRLTQ